MATILNTALLSVPRQNPRLEQLFDIFPKADYEVRPVEAFRAASEAGASYQAPTPDGSRPGVFYLNTHNLRAQPNFLVETLSIHEASPGHHFQISIQQEVESLPAFRRFGGSTACTPAYQSMVDDVRAAGALLVVKPWQASGG